MASDEGENALNHGAADLADRLNTGIAAKQEKRKNLVTPLYIEAPLENPLLFLQRVQFN